MRLAVMLAFADASIAVLALPQIVDRLHTSIAHAAWVIVAYNLSLIAGAVAIMPLASRLRSQRALLAGLGIFALASLGAGAANTLAFLIVMRLVQGAGGALLLCASLPIFKLPDINPTFNQAATLADPPTQAQLANLKHQVQGQIETAATTASEHHCSTARCSRCWPSPR